jgi:hypothetical protein
MRTTLSILILLIYSTVFAQNKKYSKTYIDVYKTADSLFSEIEKSGIDTIMMYFLYRNSSEIYKSKDNSSDQVSAYIFWQTKDSCFVKKINKNTIYQTRSEPRRMEQSDLSIATVFDYYKAKKITLDPQNFRPTVDDLASIYKIVGKDTLWSYTPFGCTDCNSSTIKYKIGPTKKEKIWSTIYLDRGNKYFIYNLSSELYHWTLIAKEIIAHQDRNQWWTATK